MDSPLGQKIFFETARGGRKIIVVPLLCYHLKRNRYQSGRGIDIMMLFYSIFLYQIRRSNGITLPFQKSDN